MLALNAVNWRNWNNAYKFTPAITTMMTREVKTIRQKIDKRTSDVLSGLLPEPRLSVEAVCNSIHYFYLPLKRSSKQILFCGIHMMRVEKRGLKTAEWH